MSALADTVLITTGAPLLSGRWHVSVPQQRTGSMDDGARQHAVIRDLAYVRERWGDLLDARLRGTPRPWTELAWTPEQRVAADDLAARERRERSDQAIGEHPAPLTIAVLDTIEQITRSVLDLEDELRDGLGFGPAQRCAPRAHEPAGWVHWAAVWVVDALPSLSAAQTTQAAHVAAGAVALMRAALQEIEPGSPIKAPCPSCGELSLRLYPGGDVLRESYVLCLADGCDPDQSVCGSRLRGHPMWPSPELDWLANRLKAAEA